MTQLQRPLARLAAAAALTLSCGGRTTGSASIGPAPPAPSASRADSAAGAPGFEIHPKADVLSGSAVQIRIRGFEPGSALEIAAERPAASRWLPNAPRMIYRASARFQVGPDGSVDLSRAAPLSGSYDRADPRGLFWSMRPTQRPAPADWPDERIALVAQQGGKTVTSATLTLRKFDPKVEMTAVGADFPGAVFARLPGRDPRPALIVLGGSEGGDWFARTMSPRLASHGYAVMGLPYYSPPWGESSSQIPGLPISFVDIPVDRLERAYTWLRAQPGVDADRIGIYGGSKGAELALIAATKYSWIDVVIAIVPTDVVWEGWGLDVQKPGTRSSFSWRGQPFAFVPYKDLMGEIARSGTGAEVRLRRPHDGGRAENPHAVAKARIPLENYRGALLVAGGDDDQVWASGPMARNIAARRTEAGLATTSLVYPDAGHALSGDGWGPTTQYDAGVWKIGGTPAANALAQAETWRATLAVLAQALQPAAVSSAR